MCRISKETVIRANEKTMKRGRVHNCSSPVVDGAITVSTRYRGVVYSQKVDVRRMQESYSRSFNAVRRNGKAI